MRIFWTIAKWFFMGMSGVLVLCFVLIFVSFIMVLVGSNKTERGPLNKKHDLGSSNIVGHHISTRVINKG